MPSWIWSMDLADGAGNGRVRKPRIRAIKTLRNLSQILNPMEPGLNVAANAEHRRPWAGGELD